MWQLVQRGQFDGSAVQKLFRMFFFPIPSPIQSQCLVAMICWSIPSWQRRQVSVISCGELNGPSINSEWSSWANVFNPMRIKKMLANVIFMILLFNGLKVTNCVLFLPEWGYVFQNTDPFSLGGR
jgi:hypothetical protein